MVPASPSAVLGLLSVPGACPALPPRPLIAVIRRLCLIRPQITAVCGAEGSKARVLPISFLDLAALPLPTRDPGDLCPPQVLVEEHWPGAQGSGLLLWKVLSGARCAGQCAVLRVSRGGQDGHGHLVNLWPGVSTDGPALKSGLSSVLQESVGP